MTLYLEDEGSAPLPFDAEKQAALVADETLKFLHCPYEAQINLLLTMNAEIRKLNQEYRGIDRATDVLSFPMIDFEVPGDFAFLEEEPDAFDPDSGELLLGDIVISVEKVLSQAEEYGHSPLREFSFLIAHSVLHLTGYDHIEEEDRIRMEEIQRTILEQLGIVR